MSYSFIRFERLGAVALIRLNRPDVLNSFNLQMGQEVQRALNESAENEDIRAIILTGEGRAFCAGQDLAEAIEPGGPGIDFIVENTYNPIIRLLRSISKPIVGVVNGVAAGAGANIAFACDITLASESASFIQSFSKIGLIPDSGGSFTLPRTIGLQRAAALTMLADKISAKQACEWGLIWATYPQEALYQEAIKLADRLASMPTTGLGLTKQALQASLTNTMEQQLELEGVLQAKAAATADYREGVNAFLEKRNPTFTGK
jgi:2-(1,2-epoxy-1,2-dihydrophenyl)acetyl-CoA isomerase